ncbi:DUF58 domain-containing protein [Halococcus agarilyticus]|uniref:DUF58 domain-containing protein n=1 Tax=Halococcus agarilyticus TaxID=1232219 RepID=UPI000677C9D9|nr:DUF58 domain-containing protein [Halococcus agarilyticus]
MRGRTRRVAVVVGVAALAAGITAVISGGGSATAPLRALLSVAGGLVGIWMTVVSYRNWLSGSGVDAPQVERARDHPAPGDEFDRSLAQFDGRGQGVLPDRSAIHDRLRTLAVQVRMRRGQSHEEARETVEAGEWPDDPAVAAFLRNPDVKLPRSQWDRARELLGDRTGPSDFQTLVRRTVDTLAAECDVPTVAADPADSSLVEHPAEEAVVRSDAGEQHGRQEGPTDPVTEDSVDGGRDIVTNRWQVAVPVGLAFVGFGLVFRSAAVVLAGAVLVGFIAYAKADTPPDSALVVERTIQRDGSDPGDRSAPGDCVDVTITVRNEGDSIVPDLRIVDGVPANLAVDDGSPRRATALRPGESISFTYSLGARRGVHEFEPAWTVVRGYAGRTARVRRLPETDESDRSLTCVPALDAFPVAVPLYERTSQYLGRLPAGSGEGVAFHSTREYQPGDASTRIDWKHLAGSPDDDLTTIRFREENAATVALVVVTDPTAYLSEGVDGTSVFERSIEATGRLFVSLLDSGDHVGLASVGSTPLWIDPDIGPDHRRRVEKLLATHSAFPPTPPETDSYTSGWVREFHRRFPNETQVVLLSPLCDRTYRHVIRRLRGYDHPVTVVSPDPTADGTVGQRLVHLERRIRIESLRETGVRVVDWRPDDDLAVALGRAATRWSK